MAMYKKFFLSCFFCLNAINAHAAFFEDEEARRAILDLREKVTEYERKLTSLDASLTGRLTQTETKANAVSDRLDLNEKSRAASLSLSSDIDSLRRDIAQINDQLDLLSKNQKEMRAQLDVLRQAGNGTDQANKTVESLQKDLRDINQTRLKEVELEGVRGFAIDQETQQYEKASTLFRDEKFAEAEIAFETFLQRFPNSFYTQFALFWYANAAYAEQKYKEAVYRYRAFVNTFLVNSRVPDALLAMAVSQRELKDAVFKQTVFSLRERFPNSEAAKNSVSYFPELGNEASIVKPKSNDVSKPTQKQMGKSAPTKSDTPVYRDLKSKKKSAN